MPRRGAVKTVGRALAIGIAVSLITSASPTTSRAASGQPVPTVAIGLTVEAVAPTVLKVALQYTCLPSPTPTGDVSVTVTQSVPLPASGFGDATLICDGANNQIEVMVYGGPVFAAGPALASAQACTGLTCGTDARKVTITEAPAPVGPLPQTPAPPHSP